MKKLSAALVLALACAGPAVAAKPTKPAPSLTISTSSAEVTFGRSVTISGTTKNIAPGTAVDLQQNPYPYSGFKPAGKSAAVDPSGNFSIAGVAPQAHTQYRVVAKTKPQSTSATAFVKVRLNVSFSVSDSTPKRGTRVRFGGTVSPSHTGKPVLIQKRTATGYRTVARTTTTSTSTYSIRVRIRSSARYRVVVQSVDQDHDNGTSVSRSLKVH
jgi:hypothetical protein